MFVELCCFFFFVVMRSAPSTTRTYTLFPFTTLFRADRLRPACSRVEQTFRPAPGGAGEQPPLVEAMGAVVPELDHVRHNPIARPVRWPGHGLAFEPLSLPLEPALEQRAGRKRAPLVRRPCAPLPIPRPPGAISLRLLRPAGLPAPLHAALPPPPDRHTPPPRPPAPPP